MSQFGKRERTGISLCKTAEAKQHATLQKYKQSSVVQGPVEGDGGKTQHGRPDHSKALYPEDKRRLIKHLSKSEGRDVIRHSEKSLCV